jgi:iron complex transport system substrate-binding protein
MALVYSTQATSTTTDHDLSAFDALDTTGLNISEVAELLRHHGSQHLSLIERIELAERLITRRRFLVGAGALALGAITGCGAPEEQAAVAPTATSSATRDFVDATAQSIVVPARPTRIVAIHDYNAALQLLSLGAPVVGMVSRGGGFTQDVSRYYDVSALTDVGDYSAPNVELIAQLQPDLIVASATDLDKATIEQLKAIAPTVRINSFRSLEAVMADYAALVGDAATVDLAEQQAAFQAVIDEIKAVLGARWQEVTASVVEIRQDQLGTFGATVVLPTDILTRVGVVWVPIQVEADSEANGGFLCELSYERLTEFNSDLLFVTQFDVPDYATMLLYQQLPVVRAGQDIFVPEGVFYGVHYPNYIATAAFLRDELRALGDIRTELYELEAATLDKQPAP